MQVKDDLWIRSACELCLNNCGILVHRVNGKVVAIEGDPANPHNRGKICAKGASGFLYRYSPYRVTKPLKRTNPHKALDEDPKWETISWEEALTTVAERLRKVKDKDPRLLYVTSFDYFTAYDIIAPWCQAFGTEFRPFSSGFYCGNNVHNIHYATEGAMEANPDASLTKYLILFGSGYGSIVNYDVMHAALEIAAKRPGGIKVVAVDPVGSYAAAKAEEWLPIRPGTDAALALCMVNLLLNDYRIYDEKFLKQRTNAPYLIGADGLYVRDPVTNKPLIWDPTEARAKKWDEPSGDYALEGTYYLDDKECQPAFQKLKEHVSKYTLDKASDITTIPADTIRRVAKEFGEAANIGGTITIKGKELPYRPASIAYYRGLSAHKHSMLSGLAVELLQTIIGGIDVPGGLLGSGVVDVSVSEEGLLTMIPPKHAHKWPYYPARRPTRPQSLDLLELFPVATYSRPFLIQAILEPDLYNTPYLPEMIIQIRTNFVKSSISPSQIEKVLQKIPFMASFALELDETSQFADIVFPDLHYLERLALGKGERSESGMKPWFFYGQKPVVEPPFDPPWDKLVSPAEIFLDLAERAGFLSDVNESINKAWGLKETQRLDRSKKFPFLDMVDRRLKSRLGSEHGLEWYMRDGLMVKERTAQAMYRGAFPGPRIHVYFEFMKQAGEEVDKLTRELGLPWDTSDYHPLPDWKPCAAQTRKNEKFDLILVNYKVPQMSFSFGHSNSLTSQLGEKLRADDVGINVETAKKKGIQDGDEIWIETAYGKKVNAKAKVTNLVHPEVVACQGGGGRFAKRIGVGRGRGINFNDLVSFDMENIDYVSTAVDSHIPVAVYKA